MFELNTERLTITEFTPDMAQIVHENSLDEATRSFVPDEVFETVEDAADTINYLMTQYGGTDGPLVYPVLLKDGTNIGYVQAVPLDEGKWEIGYHIAEQFRRQGYASEAVNAFMPVIMKTIGISKMAGICLAENIGSQKVMEKCGFVLEYKGIGYHQGDQREICRYWFTLE